MGGVQDKKRLALIAVVAVSAIVLIALVVGYEPEKIDASEWGASEGEGSGFAEAIIERQLSGILKEGEARAEAIAAEMEAEFESGEFSERTVEMLGAAPLMGMRLSEAFVEIGDNFDELHLVSFLSDWEQAGRFSKSQTDVITAILEEYEGSARFDEIHVQDIEMLEGFDDPEMWPQVVSQFLYGFGISAIDGTEELAQNPPDFPFLLVIYPGRHSPELVFAESIQGDRETAPSSEQIESFKTKVTLVLERFTGGFDPDDSGSEDQIPSAFSDVMIKAMASDLRKIYGSKLTEEQIQIVSSGVGESLTDSDLERLVAELRRTPTSGGEQDRSPQ